MCLICIEFQKERMSIAEARRALGEMIVDLPPEHSREVEKMLKDAEKKNAKDRDDSSDPG